MLWLEPSLPSGGEMEVEQNDTTKIHFEWKEHGGPGVVETDRKGFGSSLIRLAFEHELGGETETTFEPDGLYFFASFPIGTQRSGRRIEACPCSRRNSASTLATRRF